MPSPLGTPRDGLCMARALRDVGDQGERGVSPGRHAARGEEELLLLCAAFCWRRAERVRGEGPNERGEGPNERGERRALPRLFVLRVKYKV